MRACSPAAPPEKAARAAAQTAALSQAKVILAGGEAGPSAEPLQPSRKLCLKNLLGPEALADDAEFAECTDDIKEECGRFGELLTCVFPRPPEMHGYDEADVGSCFVTYTLMSSAVRAQADLDGRDFDSRKVSATFVPEEEAGAAPPAEAAEAAEATAETQ